MSRRRRSAARRTRAAAEAVPAVAHADFADRFGEGAAGHRLLVALVTGLLVGALLLVALRIDIIRMRYAMARALERETELRGQQRELVVESRRLRQPARLAELAAELGYERPTRVVHFRAPLPEAEAGELAALFANADDLPAVAASPGELR